MSQATRIIVVILSFLLEALPETVGASSSTPNQQDQPRRLETRLEQRTAQAQDRQEAFNTSRATPVSKGSATATVQRGQTKLRSAGQLGVPGAVTPEEIVAAIQSLAQQELARRRARKWDLNTLLAWTVADETNPNLSKAQKSALSTEEYLNSTFSYRLTPHVTWQAAYSLDAFHYNEFTDLSTATHSLASKLIWQLAEPLRLEAHYTFDDSEYPYDKGSSTWDQTVHLRVRHSLLQTCYQYGGWSYLNRQYHDQPTLDGKGNRIAGKYRKDQRHTGIYEVGGTMGERTALRVRQEFYFQKSNVAFQDFYDAQDYKVKVSGSHDFTGHWSSSGSFTYELKRYEQREVSDRAVAERDNVKTYQLGLTYRLSPEVDLAYLWRYVRQYSNDATQKFGDVTNSLTITAAF